MVLMPGANQSPEDFRSEGFLDAIGERRLAMDIVLVAPELAHLRDRTALAQLHDEVVVPARRSGCVPLWFVGISMGGFLALLYAADHPGDLDGICLLSPYLGNRMINAELGRFQSLANWHAGTPDVQDELAEERRIWRYIATQPSCDPPRLYLGFGRDDRFAAMQLLLATQLVPGNVDMIEGGHERSVWRQLWERFLDRLAGAAPVIK